MFGAWAWRVHIDIICLETVFVVVVFEDGSVAFISSPGSFLLYFLCFLLFKGSWGFCEILFRSLSSLCFMIIERGFCVADGSPVPCCYTAGEATVRPDAGR